MRALVAGAVVLFGGLLFVMGPWSGPTLVSLDKASAPVTGRAAGSPLLANLASPPAAVPNPPASSPAIGSAVPTASPLAAPSAPGIQPSALQPATAVPTAAKPTTTARPTTQPTARPVAIPPAPPTGSTSQCEDQDLVLAARVDHTTYTANQRPIFTWVIDNIGPRACTRDVDPGLRELIVTDSDGSRVWSDRDCSHPHKPSLVTFQPGVALASKLTWTLRSSQPNCAGPRTAVTPGSYQVVARLGSLTSGPTSFTIGTPSTRILPPTAGPMTR
ncbi:MAG TPA: hypothetical protein VGH89_16525 [Pseudonocardia sp.]|jgi:hypothetical protein